MRIVLDHGCLLLGRMSKETEIPSSPRVLADTAEPPLSKTKLKKLKRDQQWEENRAKRKAKRKEKVQEKKQRKRAARAVANPDSTLQLQSIEQSKERKPASLLQNKKAPKYLQLPVTLILDCQFDDLMMDKERKSLASQITRCYSDNHKAPFQTHLVVSSFGGHLKDRFDGILAGNHRSWKNVRFLETDLVDAANQADEWMRQTGGGEIAAALVDRYGTESSPSAKAREGEMVYLTSDSPNTLTEICPYSTYVIGGLVDKNRHKGICYKKAMDRGIKTAKLPIGDYMQMTSRFVLATNHVAEIILRWLECGDWGQAFLQVVPKRKGGTLKAGQEELDNGEPLRAAAEEAEGRADEESEEDEERLDGGCCEGSVQDYTSPIKIPEMIPEDERRSQAIPGQYGPKDVAPNGCGEESESDDERGGVNIT